uniref:Uncharacterized protein n=1 Tax=Knipowitschia caucasica TaxID=637954 RepID=A0AAV2KT90_KNICA
MSKLKGKPEKEPASASLTSKDITALLEERREAISSDFKSSFQTLASKLDGVEAAVKDQGTRITSLEDNANSVDSRLTHIENNWCALQKENDSLRERVAVLESHSRRQNIRVNTLSTSPEIDRAHRPLAPKPAPGARPRPVIIRLQVKDLIIREAHRRGPLLYKDYSPDVLKLRSEYRTAMAELYKRRYRPALLFPAKLRIMMPNGERKWLTSAPAAEKFVQDLDNDS